MGVDMVFLQDFCYFALKSEKTMNGRTLAIVAHITIIGWVIAFVTNSKEKNDLATFYIRQLLGLHIISAGLFLISLTPFGFISTILNVLVFILIIISLLNAINETMNPLPIIGEYFQEWFKTIN